jgi:hypothetical protein
MVVKKKKNRIGVKSLKKLNLYLMNIIKKFINRINNGNKDLSS